MWCAALVGVVLTSVLVVASPAQAYTNSTLSYQYVQVDTEDCFATEQNYNSKIVTKGNYCYVPDEIDGTMFHKQAGGLAMKLVIRNRSTGQMLGKAEFHPYGAHLWLYDTKDDGDGFHWHIMACCGWAGFNLTPPSTNAAVDYKDFDIGWPDGTFVSLFAYDDEAMTDTLFAFGCTPASEDCYGGIA